MQGSIYGTAGEMLASRSMRRASKPINTGHAQIGSCSISAIRFSLRVHAPRGGDVVEHGSEAGRAGEVAKQWQS